MKNIFEGCGVWTVTVLVLYLISWLLTCGIIKLITICFGLTFTWSIATGIWFIMILLQSVFKGGSK